MARARLLRQDAGSDGPFALTRERVLLPARGQSTAGSFTEQLAPGCFLTGSTSFYTKKDSLCQSREEQKNMGPSILAKEIIKEATVGHESRK